MSNYENTVADKYQTVQSADANLRLLNAKIKLIDGNQTEDYIFLSRSIEKAHGNLSRWIVASALGHVVSFVAIVVLAVGK